MKTLSDFALKVPILYNFYAFSDMLYPKNKRY